LNEFSNSGTGVFVFYGVFPTLRKFNDRIVAGTVSFAEANKKFEGGFLLIRTILELGGKYPSASMLQIKDCL
jgi:hypothetical protein